MRILSNFILIAIISRLTPNSLLAEYFIYSSIFIPLTIIASMGIGITAIAQIAKDGKLVFGHLISIHKSFFISSIASSFAITLGYSYLGGQSVNYDTALACVIGISGALLNVHSDILRSLGRHQASPLITNSLPAILTVMFVAIASTVYDKNSITSILVAHIAANLIAITTSSILIQKHTHRQPNSNTSTLAFGSKAFLVSILPTLAPSIALFLATSDSSQQDISSLGVAQRLNFLLVLPLWIISTTLPARVSRFVAQGDAPNTLKTCRMQSKHLMLLTIGSAITVLCTGNLAVTLLTGNQSLTTNQLLVLFSLFCVPYSINALTIPLIGLLGPSWKNVLLTPASIIVIIATYKLNPTSSPVINAVLAHQIGILFHALGSHLSFRIRFGNWIFPFAVGRAVK